MPDSGYYSSGDGHFVDRLGVRGERFVTVFGQDKAVPYLLLGNGEEGVGGCSLHNPAYDFNDEIPGIGAAFWIALVESQLAAA